jgi:pyruvate dehydrogenase (quinone)
MTAADILVARLIDWGVDTVFGLPGDGINGIMEALRLRQEDIRFHSGSSRRSRSFHGPWPVRMQNLPDDSECVSQRRARAVFIY